MVKESKMAPVAMFVYNRLDNTQKTIEHLKRNLYAEDTVLYIFSDGGKDEQSWEKVKEVRDYLHTIDGFKEVHIIERPENYYLEKNVVTGISQVFDSWENIIVIEDDVCTSPYFLKYMNDAFSLYAEDKKVMHIAAFSPLSILEKGDTYFTHHMSGAGGWGTWKDRWSHFKSYHTREEALEGLSKEDIDRIQYGGSFQCLKSLDRNPIPWDICWYLSIYKNHGLCLTPTHSLFRNIGLYKGTHFNHNRIFGKYIYDRPYLDREVHVKKQALEENPEIERLYPDIFRDHGMRYTILGKVARFLYKKLIKP